MNSSDGNECGWRSVQGLGKVQRAPHGVIVLLDKLPLCAGRYTSHPGGRWRRHTMTRSSAKHRCETLPSVPIVVITVVYSQLKFMACFPSFVLVVSRDVIACS